MQMKTMWRVVTPYDPEMDLFESREILWQAAKNLDIGYDDMTWSHCKTTPANWLGYNAENPSPGCAIATHVWMVGDEDKAALFCLIHGSTIEKVEVPCK